MTMSDAPLYFNLTDTYFQAAEELIKTHPAITLPHWKKFQSVTGGLRAREFSILCGATGAGKTTLLANISSQLLMQGVKQYVMSVETGHTDYMKRVMSCMAGEDFNTGDAVSKERLLAFSNQYAGVLSDNDSMYFALYDNRVPLKELLSQLDYMVNVKKVQVIMIDNLNFFMEVTRASDTIVEMDKVVHEVIMFCKRHDVHIFMVMHPRKTDDDARVRSEFDIKGSSTAVQEAQNVFLFNRPIQKDIDSGFRMKTDRELKIAKMRRRGVAVGSTIVFQNNNTKYTEKTFTL